MNILIDVNHPAQVHYFRNLYRELSGEHKVFFSSKEVPIIDGLFRAYEIPYYSYGKKKDSMVQKAISQVRYNVECLRLQRKLNIDIALGSSASNVHAALFTQAISIATTDSDLAVLPFAAKFVYPFADYLMTPETLAFQKHKKQICYPGYQELAYLHPNRFTPDPEVLSLCGLKEGEPYFVLRFTAFKAHHDIGMYGLSREQKWDLIRLLESHGRVLITTEVNDPEFVKYHIPLAPEKMHSLLYYASMLVCDSQTMTTEAAILGTPAFRCNTFAGKLTVIEEIEKYYDLAYSYYPRHFNWMLKKIGEVLSDKDYKQKWSEKRKALLRDKIDVTAFWAWMLENAPGSLEAIKAKKVDFDRFR
jgi:predicted glycosyltransferase